MVLWFSNHVYKIIILPTLVITIPNLEIFLFYQHNSTGGGNLELRQTIGCDIYDRFRMEHFPLCQKIMILTTIFLARDSTY
jgi:hypothetical protein